METRTSLQEELVETPVAKEAVLFANSPFYLLDRLRKDTSADYVAKTVNTAEIIGAMQELIEMAPGDVHSLVKFYVFLVALALKPDINKFREQVRALKIGSIQWARDIVELILQEQFDLDKYCRRNGFERSLEMVVQFAAIAQAVSVDRFTNRLSVFNLLDSVESLRFPILIPELTYLAVLRKQPGDPVQFKTALAIFVGNLAVANAEIQVDFGTGPNTRIIINFQNVPVTKVENLRLELGLPNQGAHTLEIPVAQSGPGTSPLPFQQPH